MTAVELPLTLIEFGVGVLTERVGLSRVAVVGINFAEHVVIGSLAAVVASHAFHVLRVGKEGPRATEVAEVFA